MQFTKVLDSRQRIQLLLAKPRLLPDRVLAYFQVKLRQRMTLSTDSFGWLQAILYPGIDGWQRYAAVAQQIKALNECLFVSWMSGGAGHYQGIPESEGVSFVYS